MYRKHLNSILLFLVLIAPFMAKADRFYIEPVDLEPGTTESLQFILENSQEYYGFQAQVRLPDGIEALKGSDGELDITLSGRADKGNFRVNSNVLPDGSLIMGAFSASHTAFSGNDGVLVNLKVSVADDFEGGSIEISDILFIDYQNQDVEFDSTSSAIGVLATGITLSETEISLTEGETVTLKATVNPENANNKSVVWTSSDPAVAKVSTEGVVTASGVGTTTVTANSSNGKTATCQVTVKAKPIEVSGITLSMSELSLTKGETAALTATVTPENATDKSVTWTSSHAEVATVSTEGVVTAIGAGTATVTATASNGMTATCTVTVETTTIDVSGITLSASELTLTEGETATLTATVTPGDATDRSVTWVSSDSEVATVSVEGLVTAIRAGTTTILALTSNNKTANCQVTVKAKPIEVSGITLSVSELGLTKGETAALTATVTPEDAADKSVTWASSNTEVATVSAEGVVTAVGAGTATVTATASNGMTATCTVTVETTTIEVSGITLSASELTLTEGETATLTATVTPGDATDQSVIWGSSDTAVATVSAEGVVTAVRAGTTIIIALSSNGKTATCQVTVKTKPVEVSGITLNVSELTLTEGETAALTATVMPYDVADKSVTWTSSDIKVAIVSSEGVVTAVGAGTATVTATASNGMTATCTVTVETLWIYVESLTIDPTVWNTIDGDEFTITATVLPKNATDKTLTYESSDTSVAIVDAVGNVVVLKEGSCIITVSTVDGSDLKAECLITKTSGIDAVLADPNAEIDVFDMQGLLLMRSCTSEQLKQLKPAVYIIRSGNTIRKIAVY